MTASTVPTSSNAGPQKNEAFPQLTAAQLQRLEPHGHRRKLAQGEVVGEPGQPVTKIFVVVSGQVDAFAQNTVQASKDLAISFGPGMFTGERSILAGGRFLGRIAAAVPSEVLEIDRDELLQVMATDTELSDIFLRAFILRRLQLIDRQQGDVVILGSNHCSGLLHILEFLTRNGHPYKMVDLDTDAASQELLDRFHLTPADIPVVICRGSLVLKNPTVEKLADCLGLNPTLDRAQIWDVVIVGAGPAGLGAAVYAASEGLNVVVVEANAPGGQAGTSSKIENYLGFPLGISGQELAGRAYDQAQKFGARVLIAKHAIRLNCDHKPYRVFLGDGEEDVLLTRAIIIATGVEYRKLDVGNLAKFENAGVYYAATQMERRMCSDEEVAVVGGANSAGQAAVFLAETAQRVHMLIRSGGLSSTMSRYLISRIDAHPRIVQHPRTEIVALEGNGHLERVAWRSGRNGPVETQNLRHVFTMTGAEPSTKWLTGCLALDDKGFVKTGPALTPEDLVHWPLRRQPYLLETSLPGVLAVGDVRSGSTKRVASAVGEGSIAVATVHQVLAE
ncbi:MAG: pyridine nucleotide-disulfide oxidoreductase [Gemmatimonadetes bacterium]|nr:MAG: pyridine nucleotide-disulfide oxidoreductase [Gemmatimonadota bacterium]